MEQALKYQTMEDFKGRITDNMICTSIGALALVHLLRQTKISMDLLGANLSQNLL
jgi:hypothetical protein